MTTKGARMNVSQLAVAGGSPTCESIRTNGTNGRTNGEPLSPTEGTTSLVTRTHTYGDSSLAETRRLANLAYRNRWSRRRRRLMAYGRWQPLEQVDPTAARQHLVALRDTYGLSLVGLAALVGRRPSLIVGMLYEDSGHYRQWITRRTETDILAAAYDLDTIPDGQTVDATGTRRRLQALAHAGWTLQDLAARLGTTPEAVSKWRRHGKVAASSARRTRAVFAELAMQQGPSWRTHGYAVRHGWAPALAWDDIDDPAEQPKLGAPGTARGLDMDEVAHLSRCGLTMADIGQRLGVEPDSVETACYRADRHDLLARMRANRDGVAS